VDRRELTDREALEEASLQAAARWRSRRRYREDRYRRISGRCMVKAWSGSARQAC
jgi:hypothetical protein